MHFQESFNETLFQNISYRNKIMQIIFFMTAPQDAETYIQNEVILVLINFACKLRIRFAALFEKHLFTLRSSEFVDQISIIY